MGFQLSQKSSDASPSDKLPGFWDYKYDIGRKALWWGIFIAFIINFIIYGSIPILQIVGLLVVFPLMGKFMAYAIDRDWYPDRW